MVESILREKGLLLSGSRSYSRFVDENNRTAVGDIKCFDTANSYAVKKMLMDLPTPTKPRPDTSSVQVSAAVNNKNFILSSMKNKIEKT